MTSHSSITEWAQAIGSRARTRAGRVRAIRRYISQIQPIRGSVPQQRLDAERWLPELRAIQLRYLPATRSAWRRWHRIARCIRHGRYRLVPAAQIPRRTVLFECCESCPRPGKDIYVFPGNLRPRVLGQHGHWGHRSYVRAQWVAVCGERELAAYLAAPGKIGHPAALEGECAKYNRQRKVYERWRWDGSSWKPSGVAVRMPSDLRASGRFEHGASVDECAAQIKNKRRVAAEQRVVERQYRAARLLAHIGWRTLVTAHDVLQAGACAAGIVAWCRARGLNPADPVPLARLYRDPTSTRYALRVALKRIAQR